MPNLLNYNSSILSRVHCTDAHNLIWSYIYTQTKRLLFKDHINNIPTKTLYTTSVTSWKQLRFYVLIVISMYFLRFIKMLWFMNKQPMPIQYLTLIWPSHFAHFVTYIYIHLMLISETFIYTKSTLCIETACSKFWCLCTIGAYLCKNKRQK